MPTFAIVLIVLAAITVGFFILVYFLGKRTEKKQAEQDELIEQNAQYFPMLIIDKKMMHLKESGSLKKQFRRSHGMARLQKSRL